MTIRTKLKIGYIPYLNCVPCFHFLKETGFAGELVSGVPSTLNSLLQEGKLDVSPSSSFEYARNFQDYLLLPGHSISAVGKVQSVLLFSPVPVEKLSGTNISITGESATSINLLRVILREFYNLQDVTDAIPDRSVEEIVLQKKPALLIGDRALRLAEQIPEGMQTYDLGEIWNHMTGLPFVFALWMIRRDALTFAKDALALLSDQLHHSYERVMSDPEPIAKAEAERTGLKVEQIIDYWRRIDFRLEKEHLKGLELFFQLCLKHKLLNESPALEFFQDTAEELQIIS